MINFALIDRYPVLRLGIKDLLVDHFKDINVWESHTINGFQESFPGQKPDLFIIGINQVPVGYGIDLVNRTKLGYPSVDVIVYDENSNPSMIHDYFQAGVNGYLSKQADLDELVKCISEVLKGKRYVGSEEIVEWLLSRNFVGNVIKSQRMVRLTKREQEIATYLSQGMKVTWIAEKLGRKASTISTTKAKVYKKLQVDNIVTLKERILSKNTKHGK